MRDIVERLEGYDYRPLEAINEIKKLRAALKVADEAINPPDRDGISLEKWNERLKAATKTIRAALPDPQR